jgi:putative DNA primase/helicase
MSDLSPAFDTLANVVAAQLKEETTDQLPIPLPTMPSVPSFPTEVLPDSMRGWIEDAADVARFPPEYAAVAAMCAAGSLIGRKLAIRLKAESDWSEHANLWGCIVGNPAALKSPALSEGLRFLKQLQANADYQHDAEMDRYKQDELLYRIRSDAQRRKLAKELDRSPSATIALDLIEPTKPIARCHLTSDSTPEALTELLRDNPQGLLVERDELSALLRNLEDERNALGRGLFLSGWTGREGFRSDRIGRGVTTVPKFALSVVGSIQPGPLNRYVRGATRGEQADGLLQRFQLLVWPDPTRFEYCDRKPDLKARQKAFSLFTRISEPLEAVGHRDELSDVPYLRFTPEAQELFVDWYKTWMNTRQANIEAEALENHLSKYPALLGKLSLILSICDEPTTTSVSVYSLAKALSWLEYLEPHARRAYHAATAPETDAAHRLLGRLKRGELPEMFSARDIYRRNWSGLGESSSVKAACQLLAEFGWLRELRIDSLAVGRPSEPVYKATQQVAR